MTAQAPADAEEKPTCKISLCGKEADWRVELFGKVEYYCQRHKPGVPDTLMSRIGRP